MSLSEEHRRYLTETSGLSADVIEARGYRTVGIAEFNGLVAKGLYDAKFLKCEGWMAIPVIRPDTHHHCEIIRVDKPIGGQKYLWPTGIRNAVDVYPGHLDLIADSSVPLIVTEGIKKADAIVSKLGDYKACVLAINGCWGWRARVDGKASMASPDFWDIALDGRQMTIIPDSDYFTHENVRMGWDQLSLYLQTKTKEHRLSICVVPPLGPEKQGADDFLLTHSVNELLGFSRSPKQIDFAPPLLAIEDVSMADVMEASEETVEWLIDNLLPASSIMVMAGHSRTYKTWHAMRLCLDLLRGNNCWDHAQLGIHDSIPSIYVNMEMGRSMMGSRMKNLTMGELATDPELAQKIRTNMFTVDNPSFDLANPDHVEQLVTIATARKAQLIVLDTLSMVWSGDENNAQEVAVLYKILRGITLRTGVAWLILHHMTKPTVGTTGFNKMFSVRGSGQVVQQADAVLVLDIFAVEEFGTIIKCDHVKSRTSFELKTWLTRFDAPEDTLHRDVTYYNEYTGKREGERGPNTRERVETFLAELIEDNKGSLQGQTTEEAFAALINTHLDKSTDDAIRRMDVKKQLRILCDHKVLHLDKETRILTKVEPHASETIEAADPPA